MNNFSLYRIIIGEILWLLISLNFQLSALCHLNMRPQNLYWMKNKIKKFSITWAMMQESFS